MFIFILDACLGHILESTKGFKITLGTCIDVNKRKCSHLSYLSLVLFIKGGFLCHVFAYKTGVGFNVLPFTGNMHEVLRDYRNVSCLSVCPSICMYVTLHAQAKTYLRIDVLPYSLVHMWSSLSQCAVTLTWIHISKVKVTHDI